MGEAREPQSLKVIQGATTRRIVRTPPADFERTRPRAYAEWCALRRWGRLPSWEREPVGYLLREARERAGLTQRALAERLSCTQQAVARAERPTANPTVAFLRSWAEATGCKLRLSLDDLRLADEVAEKAAPGDDEPGVVSEPLSPAPPEAPAEAGRRRRSRSRRDP